MKYLRSNLFFSSFFLLPFGIEYCTENVSTCQITTKGSVDPCFQMYTLSWVRSCISREKSFLSRPWIRTLNTLLASPLSLSPLSSLYLPVSHFFELFGPYLTQGFLSYPLSLSLSLSFPWVLFSVHL